MKELEVSVIIPVHNGEKTLKRCLESVLNQTYRLYEVIVVDNNSSDDTKKIIKEFQSRDNRIKYVFEGYKSRGSARNAGISRAIGKIIAMTDSDCLVPPNWIEELIKPIVHDNEVATMGFEEDLVKNYWTRNIQKTNLEFLLRCIEGKYISHIDTKNFAIKTSIIQNQIFDPELVALEDFDLYLRLKESLKIFLVSTIKVGHNHKSSFSGCVKSNFDRGFWIAKIYKKNKRWSSVNKEPMFESISFKNFITFPIWILFQFLKKPLGEAFFLLVSEFSWRSGIIYSRLKI